MKTQALVMGASALLATACVSEPVSPVSRTPETVQVRHQHLSPLKHGASQLAKVQRRNTLDRGALQRRLLKPLSGSTLSWRGALGELPIVEIPLPPEEPPSDTETTCFFDVEGEEGPPVAEITHSLEVVEDQSVVHVRLTLDPKFVDNTYGEGSMGWEGRRHGHTFRELVGSDHAQLFLIDGGGERVADLKLDYISQDDEAPSGYSTGGVFGGDGRLRDASPEDIVEFSTSLDRNLNERGLVFTEDSPETDDAYTPNELAPDWDFRVVYEVWVRASLFGTEGIGGGTIESIHASPSKTGNNTVDVEEGPCPEGWDGFDGGGVLECAPGYCL